MLETILIGVSLGLLGLVLGSFAGATVWRLRARQLLDDKKAGEEYDKKELTQLLPLTKGTYGKNDRSRCLHCGYTLKWYDLVPLVSWVSLGGKCRECRKPIGVFEPLMELGTAAFFVGSFLLWPESLTTTLGLVHFVLWLIAGVLFAILFAYDYKWFLLLDRVNGALIAVGAVWAVIVIATSADPLAAGFSVAGSVAVLSGLYLVLNLVSRGLWVGWGDVKLGLGLGLLLADWRLALIALFSANLIGTLVVLPGMITGKLKSGSRVPFGPLLILGAIVAVIGGPLIAIWYSSLLSI